MGSLLTSTSFSIQLERQIGCWSRLLFFFIKKTRKSVLPIPLILKGICTPVMLLSVSGKPCLDTMPLRAAFMTSSDAPAWHLPSEVPRRFRLLLLPLVLSSPLLILELPSRVAGLGWRRISTPVAVWQDGVGSPDASSRLNVCGSS